MRHTQDTLSLGVGAPEAGVRWRQIVAEMRPDERCRMSDRCHAPSDPAECCTVVCRCRDLPEQADDAAGGYDRAEVARLPSSFRETTDPYAVPIVGWHINGSNLTMGYIRGVIRLDHGWVLCFQPLQRVFLGRIADAIAPCLGQGREDAFRMRRSFGGRAVWQRRTVGGREQFDLQA
jgi:hypothetical protein